MSEVQIQQAFQQFDNFKILIIGDVMIDAYMWGKVDRISPEAPVPIFAVKKRENRMGGAANVGLNIRALGAEPIMCAIIGDDSKGQIFRNLLKKRAMSDVGILVSGKRQTTVKTRMISDNQHLLRVDDEVEDALDTELESEFIMHITHLFDSLKFDAVIFEDYDKGNLTPRIIEHVVQLAIAKDIPTLVDPKKRNFNAYKGVTLFKPNFKEICEGVKTEIPKGDFLALNKASMQLKEMLNAKYIMVTLSELGVFITADKEYHQVEAEIRDIADVSGAGDTVVSVAACCLAAGLTPKSVAAISNLAGGLVCEKVGVVPIDKKQLLHETIQYIKQV